MKCKFFKTFVRRRIKTICLFIICTVLIFGYTYFFQVLHFDEIWNYGFSYNISRGLVPYRDFNMLQTPLLFYFGSLFIKLFGHHLWSVHIFNSMIIVSMLIVIRRSIGKKVYILLPIILLITYFSYNLFCLFLNVIILYLIKSEQKNKDMLISLLVSLIFLSKQNIGFCLLIPMLFYSKNKIKSLVIFLIPIFLFTIYLMVNGAFYQFINYCFLGMLDFGKNNSIYDFILFEFFVIYILIYNIVKSKFRDEMAFYALMFQIVTVPIFDSYHFMIGLVLFLFYIFLRFTFVEYKYKYYFVISLVSFFIFYLNDNVFTDYYLYNDKESYLYGRKFDRYIQNGIEEIGDYILKCRSEYGNNIFIFSGNSYLLKMDMGIKINKYDFILDGNMGYNGDELYIKEINNICDNEECLFIVGISEVVTDSNSQLNRKIVDYVRNNYENIDQLYGFSIYSNK